MLAKSNKICKDLVWLNLAENFCEYNSYTSEELANA